RLFSSRPPQPSASTLFPYTTLFRSILAGDVALVLRLAGELRGRKVDVLLIQLDRDLALRITEVSEREVARAVPSVGVEDHATADRAEHVVEVLQGVRNGHRISPCDAAVRRTHQPRCLTGWCLKSNDLCHRPGAGGGWSRDSS